MNDNKTLYRYVHNTIKIDNRFDLDTTGLADQCKISPMSEDEYYKGYLVTPLTKKKQLNFTLIANDREVEPKIYSFYLRNPELMTARAWYPSQEKKFNITRDLKKIRISMKSNASTIYYLMHEATDYAITFPNGAHYLETTLSNIDSILYRERPEYVLLDEIRCHTDLHDFRSQDSIKININYPEEPDISTWCFDSKKEIIELDQYSFKEAIDTIKVQNNGCLYLDLDAGGSVNGFTITSLEYEKSIWYQDVAGREYDLIDMSKEHGAFTIKLFGDGGSGELILVIQK